MNHSHTEREKENTKSIYIIFGIALVIAITLTGPFAYKEVQMLWIKNRVHQNLKTIISSNYPLTSKVVMFSSKNGIDADATELPHCAKLVYEMNFDCSMCYVDLEKIYQFYLTHCKGAGIEFVLITDEEALGFIEFHLRRSIDKGQLLIAQQKLRVDGTKLYFINSDNNILMAGDFTKHPFLAEEYLSHIERFLSH